MGGLLLYLRGTTQGCEHSEGKSKPEMGLQTLSQGSQIRAQNGEGWAGSRCGVPKTETKVCGGAGYTVEDFRMSLGCGDVWIGDPVWYYMECNTKSILSVARGESGVSYPRLFLTSRRTTI